MIKQETLTFYYEHCGECSNCDTDSKDRWKCLLKRRIIPDLWGEIPKWCPLESKMEGNGDENKAVTT